MRQNFAAVLESSGVPKGIRTPVIAVKGQKMGVSGCSQLFV